MQVWETGFGDRTCLIGNYSHVLHLLALLNFPATEGASKLENDIP